MQATVVHTRPGYAQGPVEEPVQVQHRTL